MTSSWMLVAGFLFAAMGVFVKLGAEHFDPAELAFYRSMFSFLSMLAVLALSGGAFRTRHAAGHVMRGVLGTTSLIAGGDHPERHHRDARREEGGGRGSGLRKLALPPRL
jgi:drug/metabolite transporter (DMT)-like permease